VTLDENPPEILARPCPRPQRAPAAAPAARGVLDGRDLAV